VDILILAADFTFVFFQFPGISQKTVLTVDYEKMVMIFGEYVKVPFTCTAS
jgi:hypothetical protein